MESSSYYVTSDPYYAAYLRVAGVPFVGTTREGTRTWFQFAPIIPLKALKDDYYARTAKVPAFEYAQAIRDMKALTRL